MSPQIDDNPHRIRILLVEPDRLTRWSVHEYLKKCFDLTLAENADTALYLLTSETFDAIVVANDMPDDGADRIEHTARKLNDQLMVVRTTTSQADDKRRGCHTVFLEKPFELSTLASVLSNYAKTGKADVDG